ncbi:hypothetical protein DCAR_0623988 [Daucus carota subsp. sativus]|uniref:Uncharacterized protein n=1 Tax=Daucus carota subsp. sativus TaxID=79200 RepID=A0A161ZUL0_DAUCS|nr:hypothetical protein DCAR_0623988 [Daucus carota subsp. sativus]
MDGCSTQSIERKDDARIDTMNQPGVNKKRRTDRCVVGKKKNVDDDPKSVQQNNETHLEKNQTALIENKKISDYESDLKLRGRGYTRHTSERKRPNGKDLLKSSIFKNKKHKGPRAKQNKIQV